jgi:hypothetical protein
MKEDDICSAYMTHRRKMSASTVSVGKPEGKRVLGRPECRWEINIKMDLYEIEWEEVEWFYLAQNRVL